MTPSEIAAEIYAQRAVLLQERIKLFIQGNLEILKADRELTKQGVAIEVRYAAICLSLAISTKTLAAQMAKEEAAEKTPLDAAPK